MAQWHI